MMVPVLSHDYLMILTILPEGRITLPAAPRRHVKYPRSWTAESIPVGIASPGSQWK